MTVPVPIILYTHLKTCMQILHSKAITINLLASDSHICGSKTE